MKQDRFLIAILLAIGLLVIVALGLFFSQQGKREYGSEDTPEGVVRNYVIAIHDEDFNKAYSYLLDSPEKPTYQDFLKSFYSDKRLDISSISIKILGTKITSNEAAVKLILTHGGIQPFQGSWNDYGSALLVLQDNNWKLIEMPYPYWDPNWDQSSVP